MKINLQNVQTDLYLLPGFIATSCEAGIAMFDVNDLLLTRYDFRVLLLLLTNYMRFFFYVFVCTKLLVYGMVKRKKKKLFCMIKLYTFIIIM
jgi:hypothetical protein